MLSDSGSARGGTLWLRCALVLFTRRFLLRCPVQVRVLGGSNTENEHAKHDNEEQI